MLTPALVPPLSIYLQAYSLLYYVYDNHEQCLGMSIRRASSSNLTGKPARNVGGSMQVIGATQKRGYGSGFTVSEPAGAENGDLCLLFMAGTGTGTAIGGVPPSEWRVLYNTFQNGDGTYGTSSQIFYATYSASLSWNSFSNIGDQNYSATAIVFRNAEVTDMTLAGTFANTTSYPAQTITADKGDVILYCWGNVSATNNGGLPTLDSNQIASPSSFTGSDGYARNACGYELVQTAGTTTVRTTTFSSNSSAVAWTLRLQNTT